MAEKFDTAEGGLVGSDMQQGMPLLYIRVVSVA
jgi:hypothetical protein